MNCPVAAGSTWFASTRRRRLVRRWARRRTPNTSERVFGQRILARWPHHMVLDGLDTIELLLDVGSLIMHPRCTRLKEAFRSYRRQRRGGQWIDFPADGHPEEDLIDALRGGVRDALPEGNAMAPYLPRVHAGRVL